MKKTVILGILLFAITSNAQQVDPLLTADVKNQEQWVGNVMNKLTLKQKIGQLFMIEAYSNRDEKHTAEVIKTIKKYHIGGLIFMQGTPEKQAALTNEFQAKSKTPLLIGFDGEWGLDMRLKNAFRYPWNMTLGAVQNNDLIEQFGEQVGEHCKRIGIHINFAPVVDINTNPGNPIIGNRSFGENKYNVTEKAIAFTNGMQRTGVLANAKHFPGHGDTSTDSHKTLPFLDFDLKRLDSIELYPYKKMFSTNLASIMIAHLNVPSLEPEKGVPTSISYKVVTELLKEKMGFNGLVFTDALNMKGAANFAKPGDIDLAAFIAGNDMLLIPEDVKVAVKKIKKAIRKNKISKARLNQSVQKILKAKYWAGLNHYVPIEETGIQEDIITTKDKLLFRSLMKEAITVVKNNDETLPIKELANNKFAYVKLGDSDNLSFINMLNKYTQVAIVSDENLSNLSEKLKSYNTVIIGYHKSNETPWKSFKMSPEELMWLQEIAKNHKVILAVFASPYALLDIAEFNDIDAVMVSYQNSAVSQEISAQIIFGALEAKGKLPVSIKTIFPEGTGIATPNLMRLSYAMPEEVGMSGKLLAKIDSVTKIVVDSLMAPGGQVLVARYGTVIYHKSFGFQTYEKQQEVKLTDLYDLASVTKIVGGLPMIMKSEETGRLTLDSTLGELLPYLKGTNKETVTLKEVLSHVGKIKTWIPFYLKTIDSVTKQPLPNLYRTTKSEKFSIKVAENLYLLGSYKDSIYKIIAEAPQYKDNGYRYSDLPSILFEKYLKKTYNQALDKLNDSMFYKPLGANSITYNPLNKFSTQEVAPTEMDDYYRHQLVKGYVHDMGAGMMGGVSGHAGLFANANDLAKMMQMYLQGGYYGGKRYFESNTINKFNHRYYENNGIRRGLGFDKPDLDPKISAASKFASANSFGHSGFTGTYTWADPDNGILYVFLSNRVFPTMGNNKLGEQNMRTNIHNLIYEAVIKQ